MRSLYDTPVLCAGRQNSTVIQYHVLFFGDEGERGWVSETTSLLYAGHAAFDSYCQTMIAKLPAKDRKNFVVASNRRRAWELAVSSAEHAWMLSHDQRIDEFIPPMSSSGHTLPSNLDARDQFSLAAGSNPELAAVGAKPDGNGDSAAVWSKGSDANVEVLPHSFAREQFVAFCRRQRKSLCLLHPGLTTDQIDRLLLMHWNELDSTARSKYAG